MDENRIACKFMAVRNRLGRDEIFSSEYFLDCRENETADDCRERHLKAILGQLKAAIRSSPPDRIDFTMPEIKICRHAGRFFRESRCRYAHRAKMIAEPVIAYWLTKVIKP